MPIFVICLFLIWFYFWIKGNIWAALIMSAQPVIVMWLGFIDYPNPWAHPLEHIDKNPVNWTVMSVLFFGGFVPWFIHRCKRIRMERALHGVRFMDAAYSDTSRPVHVSQPQPYRPPQTRSEKIVSWGILAFFGLSFLFNVLKKMTGEDPTPILGNIIIGIITIYILRYIFWLMKRYSR